MKRLFLLPLVLLWLSTASGQGEDTLPVGAVAQRFAPASPTVESYRPSGDVRSWIFFARQTTFGRLTSATTERREIGGADAIVFDETLDVDFTKLGQEIKSVVKGETFVTTKGHFVGCGYRLGHPDSLEQLSMAYKDGRMQGFYTRLGSKVDVDLPWKAEALFWDGYMVDQLEMYLALHDLQIGTRFDDSIFMPQSLAYARIKGEVTWFMWQEIYKGKTDSVFVIHLTEPGSYQIFFTPDKRLLKLDMQGQQIRIYQDAVRRITPAPAAAAQKPSQPAAPVTTPFSPRALLLKLPHYLAFLVMAAVALLIFAARAFKWSASYLALTGGIVLFAAMPLAVYPLLVVVARDWLEVGATGGASLYMRGAVFAIVSGMIQSGLLLAGILGAVRLTKVPHHRVVGVATFLGGGFALAEAAFISGLGFALLFDWPLLERGSMIALNVAVAALIGRFLKEDFTRAVWATLAAGGVLAFAKFCPLLVQGKLVDLQLMYFIIALWSAAVVLAVLILSRKTFARLEDAKTVEPAPADGLQS